MNSDLLQLSEQNKYILETVIKFSIVILAYNILISYTNNSKIEFDSVSITVMITFVLGTGLYLKFLEPNIPVITDHPIVKAVQKDILFFGTILILVNVVMSFTGRGGIMSKYWIMNMVYVLIGILVYRIIVEPFLPVNNLLSGNSLELTNDVLQFGTILAVVNTLTNRSLLDTRFLQPMAYLAIGFLVYYLLKMGYEKLMSMRN